MSYLKETPLGRSSEYVDEYMPSLLCPVPRWDARESLELEDTTLPFHGTDIWNAYELSWLNEKGKPLVAMCELRVPCTTPNIVESKSLKLYLGSFRNHGAFHEACTTGIGQRLVKELDPVWLRIGGYWYPRGGIPIDVFFATGEPPKGVWIPDQDVPGYRGRG